MLALQHGPGWTQKEIINNKEDKFVCFESIHEHKTACYSKRPG